MVTIQQNNIEHRYYLINNPDRQGSGSAFIIDSFFYNHLQKIDSFQGRLIKLKLFSSRSIYSKSWEYIYTPTIKISLYVLTYKIILKLGLNQIYIKITF